MRIRIWYENDEGEDICRIEKQCFMCMAKAVVPQKRIFMRVYFLNVM